MASKEPAISLEDEFRPNSIQVSVQARVATASRVEGG